jgi:hypothetical protein
VQHVRTIFGTFFLESQALHQRLDVHTQTGAPAAKCSMFVPFFAHFFLESQAFHQRLDVHTQPGAPAAKCNGL